MGPLKYSIVIGRTPEIMTMVPTGNEFILSKQTDDQYTYILIRKKAPLCSKSFFFPGKQQLTSYIFLTNQRNLPPITAHHLVTGTLTSSPNWSGPCVGEQPTANTCQDGDSQTTGCTISSACFIVDSRPFPPTDFAHILK